MSHYAIQLLYTQSSIIVDLCRMDFMLLYSLETHTVSSLSAQYNGRAW